VIFTAHGVSPAVKAAAQARGLRTIDATCSDVVRTHDLVKDLVARGYEIVYVGKKGHPEPEGVIGEAPGHVHLVEAAADVDALDLPPGPIAVTNQTTLSVWDLDPAWLAGKLRVGVTSGASTPSQLTREVIQFLEAFEPATV
jgi:4-hydroxy-3-methylbut-2-enyl diphosphate reductase